MELDTTSPTGFSEITNSDKYGLYSVQYGDSLFSVRKQSRSMDGSLLVRRPARSGLVKRNAGPKHPKPQCSTRSLETAREMDSRDMEAGGNTKAEMNREHKAAGR